MKQSISLLRPKRTHGPKPRISDLQVAGRNRIANEGGFDGGWKTIAEEARSGQGRGNEARFAGRFYRTHSTTVFSGEPEQ